MDSRGVKRVNPTLEERKSGIRHGFESIHNKESYWKRWFRTIGKSIWNKSSLVFRFRISVVWQVVVPTDGDCFDIKSYWKKGFCIFFNIVWVPIIRNCRHLSFLPLCRSDCKRCNRVQEFLNFSIRVTQVGIIRIPASWLERKNNAL